MKAPELSMPRACVSCVHFTGIGFDNDEHSPFEPDHWSRKKRTPYGSCELHGSEVFATEICNSYQAEKCVVTRPVENRPAPRCPRQERFNLE